MTSKSIASLDASDIDRILDRLVLEAKPLVDNVHKKAKQGKLTGTDAWYQASYDVFTSNSPRSLQDFVCVIAYAYSWLPTNKPAACPTKKQFEAFAGAARIAQSMPISKRTARVRRQVIEKTRIAIGVVDESRYITASKVLHFWRPSLAPMFDVWVGRALGALKVDAPKSYVEYWEFADRLIERNQARKLIKKLDYRLLDELLFQLGKGVPRSPKKAVRKTPGKYSPKQRQTKLGLRPPRTTKAAIAKSVYTELKNKPSAEVRRALMDRAGLTRNGANTYYYNLKMQEKRQG